MHRPPLRPWPGLVVLIALVHAASPDAGRGQAVLEVPPGFESRRRFEFDPGAPFELQLGGLAWTTNGDPIVAENGEIRIERPGGSTRIARFAAPVFGSFLELAPDAASVYYGESTHGGIYRVPLDGSGAVLEDTLALNFDLAFAPAAAGPELAGRGFVSAIGDTPGNSIWLLDASSSGRNLEVIGSISPFSGPIAFDDAGNLYAVTSGLAGASRQRLVRFDAEQLASAIVGSILSLSDGAEVLDGLDGYFGLEWLDGSLYGTDLGFATGIGTVEAILPQGKPSRSVFATVRIGEGSGSPSFLAAWRGDRAFAPGSGARGGRLLVAYGNFADTSRVDEVLPELHFLRGDANEDGTVDLSDAVFTLRWLFEGAVAPPVVESADTNNDLAVDLSDAVYLLSYLFRGGPAPTAPFPKRGKAP